jgi:hypothetical protein
MGGNSKTNSCLGLGVLGIYFSLSKKIEAEEGITVANNNNNKDIKAFEAKLITKNQSKSLVNYQVFLLLIPLLAALLFRA